MAKKLSGDYIAGFVDGEGCFALKFLREVKHKRKNKPVYFYWDIEFAIVLREDDKDILNKIKSTLRCGKISTTESGQVRYSVEEINDLSGKIVPFFIKYPLYAKKRYDFLLWKEALNILGRNQQYKGRRKNGQKGFSKIEWKKKDLGRLKEIQKEMMKYKGGERNWMWIKKA